MGDRVLVLGHDARSFLTVVRSLGRRGLEVHVGGCPAGAPALGSRYIARAHALPDHDADPGAWAAALARLLRSERFRLVLPCDDPHILPLHAHRAALADLAPLYLLSEEAQAVVSDKLRTAALARSLGVPVPRELLALGPGCAARAVRELGLPLWVKPTRSFRLGALGRKQIVRPARSEEELRRLLAALEPGGEVLLQANVPGIGVGVELLCWEGQVLYAFQHERMHEPPGGGGSSYRRSAPLDGALLDAAARLLGALRYTGVAMVELRRDPRRGTFALLEVNGRFWGSLPLAVAAGADFPYFLYEMLVHGRRCFPPGYRVGLYARNLTGDLGYLWQRRGRLDWRLLAEARHLLAGRERWDTLSGDDPRPGLCEIGQLGRRAAAAFAARALARLGRLPPVRRAGQQRLRCHLLAARCVLFVCKGNICRSPFAAAWAARLDPGRRYLSAGYDAQRHRASPAGALAAAAAAGVDLAPHRAQPLDEALLQAADLVLAFDEDGWRALWTRHPALRRRLYRLAPLAGAAAIPDPDGGGPEAFRESYRLIQQAVAALLGVTRAGATSRAGARSAPRAGGRGAAPPPPAAP